MYKTSKDFFFPSISLLLLAIVLMWFVPSFFFRNNATANDGHGIEGLPIYLIIHGLVMTTWMLLLVIQTGLIQTKNIKVHMWMGWVGMVIAVLVIV